MITNIKSNIVGKNGLTLLNEMTIQYKI